MYDIKKIASIHTTSAGCNFQYHPLRLVAPNLRPSIEETSSYLLSYWSTIAGTNSPRAGPAAAMVDRKKCILYVKQRMVNARAIIQTLNQRSSSKNGRIYASVPVKLLMHLAGASSIRRPLPLIWAPTKSYNLTIIFCRKLIIVWLGGGTNQRQWPPYWRSPSQMYQ